MALRAIYFSPGVTVSLGGKTSTVTSWRADENRDVHVDMRSNGDVWFTRPGKLRAIVPRHSIAWIMEDDEPVAAGGGKK